MIDWCISSFVSATLQVLLQKLADFGTEASESFSNADDKLRVLRRTLFRVQSVVNDVEEKQVSDMAWRVLLQDLEQVAYDADDLLDEISIEAYKLGGRSNKHEDRVNKLLLFLFKRTSATDINAIQTKLDGMLREIDSLCLRGLCQSPLDMIASMVQTTSLLDVSHVFGRELDMMRFIHALLSMEKTNSAGDVFVIPIVGMMGVGKTTFAQLIYNYDYPKVMPHPFNIKLWVYVSREFDVLKISRSIIEAATHESMSHLLNLESLQNKLTDIFKEQKFLLILDDVWNEKRNKWDLLLKPLKRGLKGSLIVVTTGSHVVSSLVNTSVQHHLQCLSDNDCWEMVKQEAQVNINLDTVPELKLIGMRIATKCKGLPLAAKILGNLLSSKLKVDGNEWDDILDSKIWNLPVIQSELISALKWGYHYLPSNVRQCFAYCSMFPRSCDFERHKLVQMWMGEGFIVPDKEGNIIEDVGSDYFDQLLWKSFFQMEGEKHKMHDAVHDLAQSISGGKFFKLENTEDLCINRNTRHLSLTCDKINTETFEASYRCKGLRTFLLFNGNGASIKEVPLALFMELRRLRVLDLSCTDVEELTGNIGNLKHLRFLDLSHTLLKWLPESMQELCLLQTLRIKNCLKLLYLPKSTGRLKNLRHLELDGDSQLTSMPSGIGKITCLQTLREFIVGPQSGQIKELKDMNDIRGSLCIKQLEMVSNPQEALEVSLANKKYLDRLELQWTSVIDSRKDEHVLDKIMTPPHESLKELTLRRYGGRMFSKWLGSPLFFKLTSIFLYECENCSILPPLGQLPKLKYLKIDGMHELIMVDEIFSGGVSGFPSLQTLELCDMPKLESWVGVHNNVMKRLRSLTIGECPQLIVLPSLHYLQCLEKLQFENCYLLPSLSEERLSNSVESLTIMGCPVLKERCKVDGGEDWVKIEHIPYIEIDYENIKEMAP